MISSLIISSVFHHSKKVLLVRIVESASSIQQKLLVTNLEKHVDEKPAVSPTTEIKSKAVEETWLGGLILLFTWVKAAIVILYFMELRNTDEMSAQALNFFNKDHIKNKL